MDEHQVWLHQVGLLKVPVPPGGTPSKAELKDWAISRAKVDVRWIEALSGHGGDDLVVHWFDSDEDPFASVRYLPGGGSVVFLHRNGSISLKRIEESADTVVTVDLDERTGRVLIAAD